MPHYCKPGCQDSRHTQRTERNSPEHMATLLPLAHAAIAQRTAQLEIRILRMLRQGMQVRQIARYAEVSERTVARYKARFRARGMNEENRWTETGGRVD